MAVNGSLRSPISAELEDRFWALKARGAFLYGVVAFQVNSGGMFLYGAVSCWMR